MEPYLSKALWRAGAKLTAGLALVGALVGVRIVTATPVGVESDLEQLERLEAELAAEASGASASEAEGATSPSPLAESEGAPADASTSAPRGADPGDLDRLVRCHGAGGVQFMRAADCATRGGELEDLPPPEPEDGERSAEG
jgi:hypothetical protein